MNTCPVCDYGLDYDPRLLHYNICEQCGVEFGFEPVEDYPAIRAAWIAAGKPFWKTSEGPWPWLEAEFEA